MLGLFCIPILILLIAVGPVVLLIVAFLKVLGSLLRGEFLWAGYWFCIGVFMTNVSSHMLNDTEWADFTPIYIFVAIVAFVAESIKIWNRVRKESEPVALQISVNGNEQE
jgi:hypothetical protein